MRCEAPGGCDERAAFRVHGVTSTPQHYCGAHALMVTVVDRAVAGVLRRRRIR